MSFQLPAPAAKRARLDGTSILYREGSHLDSLLDALDAPPGPAHKENRCLAAVDPTCAVAAEDVGSALSKMLTVRRQHAIADLPVTQYATQAPSATSALPSTSALTGNQRKGVNALRQGARQFRRPQQHDWRPHRRRALRQVRADLVHSSP